MSATQKGDLLRRLLSEQQGRTLVFARTKRGTERLAKQLERDRFAAGMIHGDRSQAQRTAALINFEQGIIKVLVATDLAARGLHVQEIAHVINYDLPALPEGFIHRIGKTGRAGASGLASTLVSGAELFELKNIERALKLRIKRKEIAPGNPQRRAANCTASFANTDRNARRSVHLSQSCLSIRGRSILTDSDNTHSLTTGLEFCPVQIH